MSLKQFFDVLYGERYKYANGCENYWSTPYGECMNGSVTYCHVCVNFKEKEEK